MNKALFLMAIMVFSLIAKGQNISSLPVVAYFAKTSNTQKALVLYLSGDGGENAFSKSLMQQINNRGYATVLFNSQKYFWSKKTPEQAAADVDKVIRYYQLQWKVNNVIIIGYSFGADVAPFIAVRLSKETYAAVKNIVLMSPSNATDFEVHVAQLFGKGTNTGSDVPAEINKIRQKPLLLIQGQQESEKIQPASLKVAYKLVALKGGHRYDSNTSAIADTILKNL